MVNFALCRNCEYGNFDPPQYGDDDEPTVLASVFCKVEQDLLLPNSEIPDDCLFILEQKLTIQYIDEDTADRLSGGKAY